MLDYLKEKRDAGFFKSLSGLMQSCRYCDITELREKKQETCADIRCFYFTLESASFLSVLDLNAFERQNKAEGLGMVTEEGSSK